MSFFNQFNLFVHDSVTNKYLKVLPFGTACPGFALLWSCLGLLSLAFWAMLAATGVSAILTPVSAFHADVRANGSLETGVTTVLRKYEGGLRVEVEF
jgi:hypothetical protein